MTWWRRHFRSRWDGTSGRPRSSNGASSFHLRWRVPSSGSWTAVEATLEVSEAPSVAALYFWALQVSFVDRGRRLGGAHTGLQWHPSYPGSMAVNWGGYRTGGGELAGSPSPLPSALGNPNTRDLHWEPGVPYRFRIERSASSSPEGATGWQASVATPGSAPVVIRQLWGGGEELADPMVWSEVFAPCDAPGTAVRWSDLAAVSPDGERHTIRTVRTSYQAVSDGGCRTTDSVVDGDGWVQRTGTPRRNPAGSDLQLEP
ncbi:MAG: hypothetical protein JJU45_18010 [Acidimicrobiia bacterium]|nr:hypothetical protein [Acidimicrobiia bacterium]